MSSRLLTTPSLLPPKSTRISSGSIRTTVPSTTSPCLRLFTSLSGWSSSSAIVIGSVALYRNLDLGGLAAWAVRPPGTHRRSRSAPPSRRSSPTRLPRPGRLRSATSSGASDSVISAVARRRWRLDFHRLRLGLGRRLRLIGDGLGRLRIGERSAPPCRRRRSIRFGHRLLGDGHRGLLLGLIGNALGRRLGVFGQCGIRSCR